MKTKKMWSKKRIIAGLLSLVMVIGMLPAGIIPAKAANNEPIYVLAGGDFQEAGDHANSAANVTNILKQVSQKYQTMDGFLFIGDYDCETHNDATQTANGITALMGAVQGKYSNLNYANSVLAQGNHDYMDSHIDSTGGHEFNGYSAYVLNEDDYPNGGGNENNIVTLANNLQTWLTGKTSESYDDPIFIVSHLPLAFTPRTVTQGDAKYAKAIFNVLNDAGSKGLNIIFLHGHDHAYGPDNYMGGEAIYLAEGDKICIAKMGSTSEWTEETLNFTYMNAGYTGYYSDPYTYVTTAGTDKLTMTVFKIEDKQVTVERYSANGLYNLKSAGYDGSYSNTSVTNVSLGLPKYSNVYASPQTIALTTFATGEEVGTIGEYVGVTAETPADDVTTSNKGWVEVVAPEPGSEAIPGSTTYKYTLDTDGTVADVATTEEMGYLIVGSGNGQAMTATISGDNLGSTSVAINSNTITLTEKPAYQWWVTSDGKITNGTKWVKLTVTRSGNWNPNYTTKFSLVDTANDATKWSVSHKGSGSYQFLFEYEDRYSSDWVNYDRSYYLYYNSNAFKVNTGEYTVRMFHGEKIVEEGSEATPGTNGTYYKLSGDLTYNVDAGTSAENALAAVKAGLSVYEAQAMSAEEAGEGSKIEGAEVTVEWGDGDTFNGNAAGDYAVKISYTHNGTKYELGTAEVVVPATKTYYIAEGNGLYTVPMNTSADDAMAKVKAGVTVSSATDANGANKTGINDGDVTWNWVDTYDSKNYGPYTVEILYRGTSLGTVEVKVNVQYDTEIKEGWTPVGETEATGGTHTYTLDTNGIDYGEEHKYIIVDDNEAIVLNAQSTSNGTAHSITINGNTATLNTRDYEYHMIRTTYNRNRYELITKGDGSQYLYQESNGVRYGTRSSVKFQVNHHGNGVYDIHDIDGTNWYIIYNGGWTVTETTSARVRLYKYTGTTGGTPGGSLYALIDGNTVYTVDQGKSSSAALNTVKAGITGYISSSADGSNPTTLDDSQLTWTWKNQYKGNVTGSYWVDISYNGVVLGTVEVRVKPAVIDNYPEYPNEGAVKVSKTGTGIDFQSTGIAQVEVSASGVPSKKGADVIVMVDTSSSMTSHTVTGTSKTRAAVLEESLKNLITQFKAPGDDGQLLDIRVAIADFNGFYGENHNTKNTPYDRDAADMMSDDISYNANSEAQVYTGDGTLGAGAFIPVEDLAASYTLNYTSGTNYDYAMDAIYQMGTAIKESSTEERDLYVIFMSDGAAMQWNYYHSQGPSSLWNNWITGAWTADQLSLNCNTHAYYYDEVDHNGDGMRNEHRMANAIKGDPSEQYEVIRKTDTLGTATGETNMYMVPGLGATMFSISFDAQADNKVTEESMDKSIESLATAQTDATQYYYKVTTADELKNAFTAIGAQIAYAATNARFVDQMGDDFNLQLKPSTYIVVNSDKSTSQKTLTPKIEIISYDIYTRQDYLNGTITKDKIGDRKGTYTVLETVTFNDDGTQAYSDKKSGNILIDGVICAQSFWYNTKPTGVAIDDVKIPTGTKSDGTTTGSTNMLPAETFYWKLGTVQTSELAMRYYVYLDGSMEGTREAGSYATNEFATLYYDNYLGNPCRKDTVSPVMAWKSANVSYAFYLVNEKGEIIVNQTTGQTGTFANKVAVTNPVVYHTIRLNNLDSIRSIEVASNKPGIMPVGYELYDSASIYTVTINSNTTGSWEINKSDDKVASTYVTQYKTDDASAYSNTLENNTVGDDYTHTVVWFAVLWKVQALPDTVVIDYGLPVDIHVLSNDMFGEAGKLAAIGPNSDSLNLTGHDTTLASGFGANYTGTYGTAKADAATGKVRYTPNTMAMNGYDKFAYAVHYTGNENAGYYYDTVTVIPATTIYYEDNFLFYSGTWDDAETATEGITQDEDRPGKYSLTDANNIYGYDAANLGMETYSLQTSKMIHVDQDSYASAEFTFTGTGFDVISKTSGDTGVLTLKVYDMSDKLVGTKAVDTYYGYMQVCYKLTHTYTEGAWEVEEAVVEMAGEDQEKPESPPEGTKYVTYETRWVVKPDAGAALYQVPVLQVENLEYGKYRAVLTASYYKVLDHKPEGTDENGSVYSGYDLYLDAIRIYNPAGNGVIGNEDKTILNAYKADGEAWPSYLELRNKLINPDNLVETDDGSFDNVANDADMEGLVFIDGDASVGDAQISDYISYGPNNEVYLAPGQRVAFILNTPANIENVHIGIKSADGKPVTCSVANIARSSDTENNAGSSDTENNIKAGQMYGEKKIAIDTATDMYYDLTGWIKKNSSENDIIVITNANTGDSGILSLTNIKSTYKSDPNGVMTTALNDGVGDEEFFETYAYMTVDAAALLLDSLNVDIEEETKQAPVIEPDRPSSNRPARPGHTEPSKPEKVEKPVKPDAPNKPGVNKNDKKPGSVRENGWFF